MITAVLLNHLLGLVGIFQIVATAVKISRGYPVSRWLF